MLKYSQMFENTDPDTVISNDIIIGVPSGEVIDISKKDFIDLKNSQLIKQADGYYTYSDHNYKKIKNIINQNPARTQYIHYLMDQLDISNYKINLDLTVDVKGNVNISQRKLETIPIKFGMISGNFDCSFNRLTNLSNSPNIVEGFFDCSSNELSTLIGGPSYVNGGYYCTNNFLEDLYGYPKVCKSNFDCSNNHISSLIGLPENLTVRYFDASFNKLRNLSDSPKRTMNFNVSHNLITTLVNGPKDVMGVFDCTYNLLFNLIGMPSYLSIKYAKGNRIEEVDFD